MTNEEFCRLHTAYNGEKLTDVGQLVSETFNGEELKEFVEFCIKESNKPRELKCKNLNPPCSPNLKYGILECCECNWSE